MASEVDICNSALSRLGDSANVVDISPPDGSAQAAHCARWFPIARQQCLAAHAWGFATTRAALALLVNNPAPYWEYAYALPKAPITLLEVYPSDSQPHSDDGMTSPWEFTQELNEAGERILLTNANNAVCRYVADVKDVKLFTPGAVDALSWLLASYLAGPVLKGDAGRAANKYCLSQFALSVGSAAASDAQQRLVHTVHAPAWVRDR